MTKRMILLDSVTQIKDFVNLVCRYPNDFDLVSGRFTIDAKSIMGIFFPGFDPSAGALYLRGRLAGASGGPDTLPGRPGKGVISFEKQWNTDASLLASLSSWNRKHGRACPAVC